MRPANLLGNIRELLEGNIRYQFTRRFRTLRPEIMTLNVTYRCNAACIMCNIHRRVPEEEFTARDFERVLKDPILQGVRVLAINGGEPALRRDLPEIVRACLNSMPSLRSLTINTNALLPERVVDDALGINALLRPKGVRLNMSVSIDGIGSTHDRIRGVKGAFEKAAATLRRLKEMEGREGFHTGISTVLFKRNAMEFESLLEFGSRLGVPVNFAPLGIHETFVANRDAEEELCSGTAQEEEALGRAMKRLSTPEGPFDFSSLFWKDLLEMVERGGERGLPCPLAFDSLVLDAVGDVYLCLSEPAIGNVKGGKGLSEIWHSEKTGLFRRYLLRERCRRCNSSCMAEISARNHIQRYLWFLLTRG